MRELGFVKAIEALERAEILDPVVKRVRGIVLGVIRPQAVRDVLHGVPTGHPVHPVLVQIPVGTWTSAAILDLLPGTARPAGILIGLGVLGAAPSVASGYTDWSALHEQQQRVGVVHSAANAVAVGLYAVSWLQRQRGHQVSGKVLGYLGFAIVGGAGVLGSHLAYRQAAGANHAEDVPHRFPSGWHALAPLDDLPDGALTSREVAGLPLLALRRGSDVDVLSDTCSHLSGPLSDGQVSTERVGGSAEACITCPWHGSVFAVGTGEVVHGPATAPQPRFETRVTNGLVEVMLPGAG